MYDNVFDVSYDGVVSVLVIVGYFNMVVSVGEIGWLIDGNVYVNIILVQKFNQQFVNYVESGKGMLFCFGKLEVYVFSLFDENVKSMLLGNFE